MPWSRTGGGFTPMGFSVRAPEEVFKKIKKLEPYFAPYGAGKITKGGGGVDISQLKNFGAILSGLIVDTQRYFDYHHSAKDTFDKVNRRELQLGSAAIAGFIYLVDKLDIK